MFADPDMATPLATRRLALISATAKAGRDRSLDFEVRVRCARAAAVGAILFGTPQTSALDGSAQLYNPPAAVNTLKLPTVQEMSSLLDTYRANVEWMCNVVVIDLNRARIDNFLNWYHSNPQTLPADPPLIPLVLVILALAIQARRTVRHSNPDRSKRTSTKDVKTETDEEGFLLPGGMPSSRAQTPHDEHIESCSSEKELLETAGRCIDALQIACPSNWASAFSAPLDLVRANLLRGLWHLSELHLQFAGGCFAVTMRLAHAAALNRDTRHWESMGKEEAQARRNMFWNVAMLEVLHTNRVVQPPSIFSDGYDTQFPTDHDALLNLYRRAGLIEPFIVEGRRSNLRVQPMTQANFDFHLARFQLTDILIKGNHQCGSRKGSNDLAEAYEGWKSNLPQSLAGVLDKNILDTLGGEEESKGGKDDLEADDAEAQTRYLQGALLQMISLSTSIQIHRPQVDETGRWRPPEGQAQRSLELCIDSAQRLIWLIWSIVSRSPGPPYLLYNFCIFYCFQAAIIIAIQSALCGPNQGANEQSTFAVLARPSLDKAVRTLDLIAGKEGLRYVAEQASRYAATLREIDVAQQRSKSGESGRSGSANSSKVNAMKNVPGAVMGAPPPIIVEGDGKKMGGQGYPSRHPSSESSPQPQSSNTTLTAHATNGGALASTNQFDELSQPHPAFGFDFNDLQVFPSQQSNEAPAQPLDRSLYADRPLHEGHGPANSSSFGFNSAPTSYTRSGPPTTHHSTGLDLLAAQVDQARGSSEWSSHRPPQMSPAGAAPSSASWGSSSFASHNGQTAYPVIPSWSKDALEQQQQQQHYHRSPHQQPPSTQPMQPAAAPPVESMGETFATDWTEWERAVDRLLHSDR